MNDRPQSRLATLLSSHPTAARWQESMGRWRAPTCSCGPCVRDVNHDVDNFDCLSCAFAADDGAGLFAPNAVYTDGHVHRQASLRRTEFGAQGVFDLGRVPWPNQMLTLPCMYHRIERHQHDLPSELRSMRSLSARTHTPPRSRPSGPKTTCTRPRLHDSGQL